MTERRQSVLILGGGINGAAIARELALQALDIHLVDVGDLAGGATSSSSRLIHGGLRYLEYGELALVREALAERTRLLRLAPQFVRPLELFIPLASRAGGLVQSAARFFRLERLERLLRPTPRGLWLVQLGLWLYDRYARDPTLPRHRTWRAGQAGLPVVDHRHYRWLCSYFDAQIRYPERFVLALLADARSAARERGSCCEVWTYHRATLRGGMAEIADVRSGAVVRSFHPDLVINATGAAVDGTLQQLGVAERRLMGGTQGSHILTRHQRLRTALGPGGIYAEAADGRPVFLLPLGPWSLVGTTDLAYQGDPAAATASEAEIDYLVSTVNQIVPEAQLARADIDFHYSGVRPLPYEADEAPGAVTRRHWLQEHPQSSLPLYSVIGGKLTTCRSLAEETAETVLKRLGYPFTPATRDRPIPGGQDYPATPEAVRAEQERLAAAHHLPVESIAPLWDLLGNRVAAVLEVLGSASQDQGLLSGTPYPRAFARWVIEQEHVSRLADLVERRLMLLYEPELSLASLYELAGLLVEAGKLSPGQIESEVAGEVDRLAKRFGKRVDG